MRFGFIADELESVVPSVVRGGLKTDQMEDGKGVQYWDLLALLGAAAQSQQQVIDGQQKRLD